MERLTFRNDQGVVMIYAPSTRDSSERLCAIEDILGDDYDLDRLKEIVEAYKATEKRPSNGDIFRKMTDEKLAYYFSITFANGFGEGNFLEWLKAPANDEVWKNFKEDAG